MKYRKFNKYEKKEVRKQAIEAAMSGSGLYIYQNSSSNAELTLPRSTHSGVRKVAPNAQFQGDSYFMQLVKTGMLRLVEVLQTPEQELEAMAAEKLILDQPDCVTQSGPVEHVVDNGVTKQKPIHEAKEDKAQPPQPVLLNEGPVDDGFVIVGE